MVGKNSVIWPSALAGRSTGNHAWGGVGQISDWEMGCNTVEGSAAEGQQATGLSGVDKHSDEACGDK